MANAFTDIAFTPSVRAAQERYHSRTQNARMEAFRSDNPARLTEAEAHFIQARDTFFMATVGENGWPYVQHRGGPPGFLKVLDDHTLGFADYRGNRQYISVGTLGADGRVLLLLDFANRHRLKIWARAEIVHREEQRDLVARLEDPDYGARVERGILFHVEALDWNCPQHITPRYTLDEVTELVGMMHDA